MKRSYAKKYFYGLGFSAGKNGLPSNCDRRNRLSWPKWCRHEWAAGWLDGLNTKHKTASNGEGA